MSDTKVIRCRAVPGGQGHNRFARGGHVWPIDGRTVRVTRELYDVLKAEPMLAVDSDEQPSWQPETKTLELVDNYCGDREHNASRAAREENKQLRARLEALEAEAENERLKERIAAVEHEALKRENARLEQEREALLLSQETSGLRAANEQLRADIHDIRNEEPPPPPAEPVAPTREPKAKEPKARS